MTERELRATAGALVAPGKGILAADESAPTIEKRLRTIGVPSTEENRRTYRELLFTSDGLGEFISGVILFDETIRQSTASGIPFAELLRERGMIPGIKVDRGVKVLAGFPGEKVAEGLDGLRDRFAEYRDLGAGFAKFRAVLTVGENIPTRGCIDANAHALARYAALSQEAGLVPIVEPEVLMDGSHTIEQCFEATEATLERVFAVLHSHRVSLEGMLLKPNMVLSGKECADQAPVDDVARETLSCFRRVVPAAVPGTVFLSGGQTAVQATQHLNAMNRMEPQPWQLSFSFSRALQEPVLEAWRGEPSNASMAQSTLLHRARLNSAARRGEYEPSMEKRVTVP